MAGLSASAPFASTPDLLSDSNTRNRLAAAKSAMGRTAQAANRQNGSAEASQALESTRKAAQDFEAFFASQMLQPMFEGVETNEMFGGGIGEDTWKSMMVDQYGKEIARSGRLGIADQVMSAMLQAQEKANAAGSAPLSGRLPASGAYGMEAVQ